MKRQLGILALALVAVLVLAGQLARAAAGPGPDDVQDSLPAWAPDGVRLVFDRTSPRLRHVVTTTSAGKRLYVAWPVGQNRGFADGYFLVQSGDGTIVTAGGRFAGPNALLHGTRASASPDGLQIAYVRDGTLYVVRTADVPPHAVYPIASPPERAIASGVEPPSWDVVGPAWSPDGSRIAIASGSSLLVVNVDGSGSRTVFSGENQSVDPSWSADGQTIAFERNAAANWQIWVVGADGGGARELLGGTDDDYRYPQFSPVNPDALAYISDRQHLIGGATRYQYALYLRDLGGTTHKLLDDVHPYSPPRWSPTAALIADAAGQECRRWGIYVGRSEAGARFHRRSNLCRFDGTPRADTIHGSPYFDIMNGLGGNDTLYGSLGNDKISGEGGNDTILGGAGNDFVLGGPGDDRIYGGPGNDVIIGGNGRDRIDCGPGVDTVEGAGPLDRIARNCEHVRH